jgi:hypothetical protein
LTIRFRGGKLPAQPARPQLRLEDYVTPELPAPPASVDWQTPVDATGWPMYGNAEVGDCTFAEIGHHIQLVTKASTGTAVQVSDSAVLTGYEAVSGYKPGDPSTDVGCRIADVMDYWLKTGVGGHRIIAHASIDPSNTKLVKQAIALFGGVSIGMNVPKSAEDQFNAGQPWDYVRGSRSLGGHCVLLGAYGPKQWKVITWAAEQEMTDLFYQHEVDEVRLPITLEWFKDGKSPTGIDMQAMGADYAALTGRPNPFANVPPSPTPTPPPAPTPSPAPAPDPRLVQAHALMDEWAADNHVKGQ